MQNLLLTLVLEGLGVDLVAQRGTARAEQIDVWQMKSAWQE